MKVTADAMTRAAQIAAGAIKTKFRADGGKLRDFRISDHRKAIGDYLKSNPQLLETASKDLRRWILAGAFGKARRAKLLSCEQTRRR
jgi:hypothetical protein